MRLPGSSARLKSERESRRRQPARTASTRRPSHAAARGDRAEIREPEPTPKRPPGPHQSCAPCYSGQASAVNAVPRGRNRSARAYAEMLPEADRRAAPRSPGRRLWRKQGGAADIHAQEPTPRRPPSPHQRGRRHPPSRRRVDSGGGVGACRVKLSGTRPFSPCHVVRFRKSRAASFPIAASFGPGGRPGRDGHCVPTRHRSLPGHAAAAGFAAWLDSCPRGRRSLVGGALRPAALTRAAVCGRTRDQ